MPGDTSEVTDTQVAEARHGCSAMLVLRPWSSAAWRRRHAAQETPGCMIYVARLRVHCDTLCVHPPRGTAARKAQRGGLSRRCK